MNLKLILALCLSSSLFAQLRFDSATTVGVDASMRNGKIISYYGDTDEGLKNDIQDQLMYLIGPFNHFKSTPDIGHVEVDILSKKRIGETDEQEVTYNVKFLVSWDKAQAIPSNMNVYLPKSIIKNHPDSFFDEYSSKCSKNADDPELSSGTYYYFFRPEAEGCSLANGIHNSAVSNTNVLTLSLSSMNTENKYPEYDKVWEDGKLVYTVIFAADKEGVTSNFDAGVNTYNLFYRSLINGLGRPISSQPWVYPKLGPSGFSNPKLKLTFRTGKGIIEVNMFMLDKYGVQNPPAYFSDSFKEATKSSDVISYNGHSGYEANIQALANLGVYSAGRYHLVFINGCDTFSYVDDSLRSQIASLNPGSKDYQHIDMILNTLPTFYGPTMANSNFNLLASMHNGNQTFRTILSSFPANQKAVVIGEEDNTFTLP